MIQQIQLVLSPPNDVRIPQSWSYRLYGWLMSQISSEFGEQMHLQGEHPIAHFLCFSPEKQSLIWTVNLLNDAARQVVFPVLESAKEIPLHELTLPVSEVRIFPAVSAEELILARVSVLGAPAAKPVPKLLFCRLAPSSSPAAILFSRRKLCFCKV